MSLLVDVVRTLEKAGVRHAWHREIVESAETKDAWDIRSLLDAIDNGPLVASEVERERQRLPAEARQLWSRLRAEG